jgi:hypothetical protein
MAETEARRMFKAIPGYPFFPCRICVAQGYVGQGGCDHTVLERAQAMHPALTFQTSEVRS